MLRDPFPHMHQEVRSSVPARCWTTLCLSGPDNNELQGQHLTMTMTQSPGWSCQTLTLQLCPPFSLGFLMPGSDSFLPHTATGRPVKLHLLRPGQGRCFSTILDPGLPLLYSPFLALHQYFWGPENPTFSQKRDIGFCYHLLSKPSISAPGRIRNWRIYKK